MFSQVCVHPHPGGYLPWLGSTYLGQGVPTLARGYLPWLGVPTLAGRGTYLGHRGTCLGWGYPPWPGGYLPWLGVPTLAGRGTYLGQGGTYLGWEWYLPWPGGTYLGQGYPLLPGQHREYLLCSGRYASCVHAGGLSC